MAPEPAPILSPERPVCGQDLTDMLNHIGGTVLQLCRLLGISPVTWYKWVNQPETPIPNRTAELHLRLLDAVPQIFVQPPSPIDVHNALQASLGQPIKHTDFALMLGLEPYSGRRWMQGEQTSDTVLALCHSLKRLANEMPPGFWNRYRRIIDQQAAIEGVDLWGQRSWHRGEVRQRSTRAVRTKKPRTRTQSTPPDSE